MFRIKLISSIAILLLFTVTLVITIIWGVKRAEYEVERSHLAHQALESYLRFSLDTYRHFKERLDIVLLEAEPNNPSVIATGEKLARAIEKIESFTLDELEHVEGTNEHKEELEELTRLKRIQLTIQGSMSIFDTVERLIQEGRRQEAIQLINQLMEHTLDKDLVLMIDDAVADEYGEVMQSRENVNQLIQHMYLISSALIILATCFGITIGVILWRNIKGPIDALVHGTRAVTSGNFSHRIEITGRDEFADLARNFNTMADKLHYNQSLLVDAHHSLEQKIEQRTTELEQAYQALQRMDEVRREFFADISHELRTPLTIIRGEAEVTLRSNNKSPEEYQTALRRIVDLTEQLTKLVGDLLFLARTETSNAKLKLSSFNLTDLITEVWEDAQTLAHSRQQIIELDIGDEKIAIKGDRMRLKQLMHILIDNACKYSGTGTKVLISASQTGEEALIHVEDEGIGINEKDQAIIFERFYRSDNAYGIAEGSGLGLPLARSITLTHGGEINIKSKVNEGTTFTVRLPLTQ